MGAESQGTALPWSPGTRRTNREASDYIKRCVGRLAGFALEEDQAGEKARSGLGQALRSLVRNGFIDTVETVIRKLCTDLGHWPQALRSLGHVLFYDADRIDGDVVDRVKTLVAELQPTSLNVRIRLLITEMPWDYLRDRESDSGTQHQRQVEAVRELTLDLLRHPETLSGSLSQLSSARSGWRTHWEWRSLNLQSRPWSG